MFLPGEHYYVDAPPSAKWDYFTIHLKKKWATPHDANGEEVVVVGDSIKNFVKVKFLSLNTDVHLNKDFLVPKMPEKHCRCDIFVTGCVCGFFEKEQNKNDKTDDRTKKTDSKPEWPPLW